MGENVKDETFEYIESLSEGQTKYVNNVFIALNQMDFKTVEKALKKLFTQLGPRGVLTMLGFRKTTGS
jgi:hypothetical protein